MKPLVKHTIVYGVATVLPRLLNIILTPLHTSKSTLTQSQYGVYQGFFAYMILGNVLLTYGLETAFFRFMNKKEDTKKVSATCLTSILITTGLFLIISLLGSELIAQFLDYPVTYIRYAIWILALDTLVAIPFAWFRNIGKSLHYSLIKIANVSINLGLNLLFLVGFPLLESKGYMLPSQIIFSDKVEYIFVANLIASLATFLYMLPLYRRIGLLIDVVLWKKLLRYAFPVLVAGVAFSINEAFDRIFIRAMYPESSADAVVGMYAGCYKMGVFMTLFITAYRLGIEPFFFSKAEDKNAPNTYARITEYFCIFAGGILLFVCVYIDFLKWVLIPNSAYWEALIIVPFILLANVCLGIYHSISVWYKVTDRTHWGAIISVVGGIITVLGNLLLIPILGYLGAAVATLLAYGGMMAISWFVGQKKYYVPYNIKHIGGFLGFATAAAFLNFYLFDKSILLGSFFVLTYVVAAVRKLVY